MKKKIKSIKDKLNKFIKDKLKKLSENQKRLIFHWLRIVLVAEVMLFLFRDKMLYILFLISTLFFVGFLLRLFKMYPGNDEPLDLDASAVVIALLITFAYRYALISVGFAMLFAPVIILPHIIYIIRTNL